MPLRPSFIFSFSIWEAEAVMKSSSILLNTPRILLLRVSFFSNFHMQNKFKIRFSVLCIICHTQILINIKVRKISNIALKYTVRAQSIKTQVFVFQCRKKIGSINQLYIKLCPSPKAYSFWFLLVFDIEFDLI